MAAAARRFLLLLGGISGGVLALAILFGLVLGTSLSRSISVGFYLVGAFLLVAGFFTGIRLATPEERADAVSTTGVFITLGFVLILIGVIADSRYGFY